MLLTSSAVICQSLITGHLPVFFEIHVPEIVHSSRCYLRKHGGLLGPFLVSGSYLPFFRRYRTCIHPFPSSGAVSDPLSVSMPTLKSETSLADEEWKGWSLQTDFSKAIILLREANKVCRVLFILRCSRKQTDKQNIWRLCSSGFCQGDRPKNDA